VLEVQDHRGALSRVEDADFFAIEEGWPGVGAKVERVWRDRWEIGRLGQLGERRSRA
jgi:hypothetical protein